MSNRNQVILDELKSRCLTEFFELVRQIEAQSNVSSEVNSDLDRDEIDSNQKVVEAVEEPIYFDVVLEKKPPMNVSYIQTLKVLRSLTDLNLRAVKDLIDSAPTLIRSELSFDAAAQIKQQLEAAGAIVSLREIR